MGRLNTDHNLDNDRIIIREPDVSDEDVVALTLLRDKAHRPPAHTLSRKYAFRELGLIQIAP